MKYKELENKDIGELRQIGKNSQVKLGKLRFELANKSLKDFSQIKKTRREIAQVMTAVEKKRITNID